MGFPWHLAASAVASGLVLAMLALAPRGGRTLVRVIATTLILLGACAAFQFFTGTVLPSASPLKQVLYTRYVPLVIFMNVFSGALGQFAIFTLAFLALAYVSGPAGRETGPALRGAMAGAALVLVAYGVSQRLVTALVLWSEPAASGSVIWHIVETALFIFVAFRLFRFATTIFPRSGL
jgi:hypothetical protein